jgi:hypothetical protein
VGEDGGDGEAAGALDVHEEGTGSRHKGLFVEAIPNISHRIRDLGGEVYISVSYLKLVLASLSLRSRVEEVDRENLLQKEELVLADNL